MATTFAKCLGCHAREQASRLWVMGYMTTIERDRIEARINRKACGCEKPAVYEVHVNTDDGARVITDDVTRAIAVYESARDATMIAPLPVDGPCAIHGVIVTLYKNNVPQRRYCQRDDPTRKGR